MSHHLSGEEREYFRLMRLAIQRYCTDNALEPLDTKTAGALRHDFHREFLGGVDRSHRGFDHGDYDVAFEWLKEFIRGGLTAAHLVDLAKVRNDGRRRRAFNVIDRLGRKYIEPWLRQQLRLPDFEAVDWDKVSTELLEQAAMTVTNRARSRQHADRGLSRAGRAFNRMDDLRRPHGD